MASVNDEQSVANEIIEGLTGLRDALRDGERLHERFTMRTVQLELEPRAFTPEEVRELRDLFRSSQAVFAKLIGVKPSTIQSWEQGRSEPPAWGRRLLELMTKNPGPWKEILEDGARRSESAGC